MAIFEPIFKPVAKSIEIQTPIQLPVIEKEFLFGREHAEVREIRGRNHRVQRAAKVAVEKQIWEI